MSRIRFENSPSINTPINAENLNKLNNVVISPSEPTTGEEIWLQKSNNLLKFEDFTTTVNGITFSMKNQILTISGTATAYTQGGYIPIKKTLEETETLTVEVDGSGVTPMVAYSFNGQYTYLNLTTVELKQDTYINQIYFIISEGTTVNATVKLQLEKGSGYSGWQPYIEKKIYTKNDNGAYEELINTSAINSLIPQIKVLTPNYEYLYEDFQYSCVQIGKVVFLNIGVLALRQAVSNGELLVSGLPPALGGYVGALHGHCGSVGHSIRCVINADGTLKVHWGGTTSIGDAANKQFAGTFIYITTD